MVILEDTSMDQLRLRRRSAVSLALVALLIALPAAAAVTVGSVSIYVPATGSRAAASFDVVSYSLDADADFSLVRAASKSNRTAASRVKMVLPSSVPSSAFTVHGDASHFSSLTIRQIDPGGSIRRRSVFYNARIVRVETFSSDAGPRRRVTFVANRIASARARQTQ